MKQKKSIKQDNEEELNPTENLEDMNELLSIKCHRCGRKISLMTCGFDEDENAICRKYSGGCRG
jgi:hypothetical protein